MGLNGPVGSPKLAVWTWRGTLAFVLVMVLLSLVTICRSADNIMTQSEALTEMVRLHNAGLLLDLTVPREPWTGEIQPGPSWRFRLEDSYTSQLDGSVCFNRQSGRLRALSFEAPQSTLVRLGLACEGHQTEVTRLLKPGEVRRVVRLFTAILVPEVKAYEWNVSVLPRVDFSGRASAILRYREDQKSTTVQLDLIAVERGRDWRLEIVRFTVEEKDTEG